MVSLFEAKRFPQKKSLKDFFSLNLEKKFFHFGAQWLNYSQFFSRLTFLETEYLSVSRFAPSGSTPTILGVCWGKPGK